MANFNTKIKQYSILILLAFIWGTSFIFMKKGLQTFSSLEVALIRIVSASIVLIPLSFKHILLLNRRNVWLFIVSGLLGNGIPAILFATAQTKINSSLAGMLNATTPLFTIVVGYTVFKSTIKKHQLLGTIIGFIGVLGLMSVGKNINFFENIQFTALVTLATLMYAINVNLITKYLKGYTGLQISSLIFLLIGPVFAYFLIQSEFYNKINTSNDLYNLSALILLGVLGTAFATILFNDLLKVTSAVFASSVTYLIPVFAIIWGLIDGENIYPYQYMFICVILLGVMLVNYKKG